VLGLGSDLGAGLGLGLKLDISLSNDHTLWTASGRGPYKTTPVVVYTSSFFYSFFYPIFLLTISAISSRPTNIKQPNFQVAHINEIGRGKDTILKIELLKFILGLNNCLVSRVSK